MVFRQTILFFVTVLAFFSSSLAYSQKSYNLEFSTSVGLGSDISGAYHKAGIVDLFYPFTAQVTSQFPRLHALKYILDGRRLQYTVGIGMLARNFSTLEDELGVTNTKVLDQFVFSCGLNYKWTLNNNSQLLIGGEFLSAYRQGDLSLLNAAQSRTRSNDPDAFITVTNKLSVGIHESSFTHMINLSAQFQVKVNESLRLICGLAFYGNIINKYSYYYQYSQNINGESFSASERGRPFALSFPAIKIGFVI